jgi:predicted glutamine amidotransferase
MKECWKRNSDGAGFMFALDGKIVIKKELESFDKIWRRYYEYVKKPELEEKKIVVFHFRIQTHGNIDEDNCHPFYINTGRHMAFCHNGTIRNVKAGKDDTKSDTVQFKDKILDHLPKNWMHNPGIMSLMVNYVDYNKLAFLKSDGNVLIFNKSKGEEDEDGIWYSNSSYKPIKVHTYEPTKPADKSYNIHDRRKAWNRGNRHKGYEGYYGELDYEDIEDNDLANTDIPMKGQIWDRWKCKHVWPCDHTDSERINKGIKDKLEDSGIDDAIETITELDTVSEIINKIKGDYTIDESESNKEEEVDEEKLIICRRCGQPIMSQNEILLKTCTWCKKVLAENSNEQTILPGLTRVEESSGESRSQLH